MKKLQFFLKVIVHGISEVIPMDDGSLFITYDQGTKQTLMPITDYENAVALKEKIDGLRDRIAGLC